MATAAQVRPAPNPTRTMLSPRSNLPSRCASSSAMATAAADVLPYLWRFTKTFSLGMVRRSAMASIMRRLAWCGMTSLMLSAVSPASSMTASAERFMALTACLKTSRPCMARDASFWSALSMVVGQAEPPPGMLRMEACEPSVPTLVARMRPEPSVPLVRTAAPAPSPKRTQVLRSDQLVNAESFSAPMMSAFLKAPSEIMRWAISMA